MTSVHEFVKNMPREMLENIVIDAIADGIFEVKPYVTRVGVVPNLSAAPAKKPRKASKAKPAKAAKPAAAKQVAKAVSAAPKSKGEKRDPAALEALTAELQSYILNTPGQRIEQIAAAMGVTTQSLALPVKKLLAAGAIGKQGNKRATVYHGPKSKKHTNGVAATAAE